MNATSTFQTGASHRSDHHVSLVVPSGRTPQLVFRQQLAAPLAVKAPPDCEFYFCQNAVRFIPHLWTAAQALGRLAAFKAVLKLMAGRRSFYFVAHRHRLVHCGWVTRGSCRLYPIESDAYVIGPIWTDESARGLGIASYATAQAMTCLAKSGSAWIYIDTSIDNHPCLSVISKCGFGAPLAALLRPISFPVSENASVPLNTGAVAGAKT